MKKWILYITVFLCAVSCVSESTIDIDPRPPQEENDPGRVTLQIVFPKMSGGTLNTRGLTSTEEHRIDSLEVFVFKNASNSHSMSDTYLYRVSLPHDSIHPVYLNDTTYKAGITLKTMPAEGQRLICVANIPKGLTLSLTEDVTTVTSLVSQLQFSGSPWHETPTSASYGIPMWGQMNTTLKFDPGEPLPNIPVVSMVRAMAKIEVGVDVHGTGDPALGFGHIFTLDSVYICNASASGYIAPHNDYIDKPAVAKTNPVSQTDRNVIARYKFDGNMNGDRKMSNTIYVPETDSLITTPATIKPAFLVIRAQYYDVPGYYYYRIDFTRNDEYKPLLRNHSYLVNILNIRMPGYHTLAEAMNAPLATTNYAVTIDHGTGIDPISEEIMDISVYKNEYMLGVNTSEVMFDWGNDSQWLGKTVSGLGGYQLVLYTDCESGWTATSSDVSWLNVSSSSGGKTPPSPAVNLEITTKVNFTGEERTGVITLTAGLLKKEITVRQSGGANSVIVRSGNSLNISVAYATKARAALDLPVLSPTAVSVAWNKNINGLSPTLTPGPDATINSGALTLVTTQWGNALVVLTAGTDTVWSWHVWVVNDDGINASYHSMNTRPVFMDRLLGGSQTVTDQGQPYYQWGRKDPFMPGEYGVQPATTSSNYATIMQALMQYPKTFYAGDPPYYNWAGSLYYNNDMWNERVTDAEGNIKNKKTYNDPCPTGWRVPYYQETLTPWQNETTATINKFRNTGYLSPTGAWLNPASPAPGYLWTGLAASFLPVYATINATGTLRPYVTNDNQGDGRRGHGYVIRCVKDISRKY
ncbi:MAG: BACON domain-containing protein [Tannerella sp.]|jgi:hypothetical protein|nr:BACON domain-containing protein [Tannerella sp.]